MTRLATGETELYKLANDPHEFTNLAGNPKYAEVIEELEKHLRLVSGNSCRRMDGS